MSPQARNALAAAILALIVVGGGAWLWMQGGLRLGAGTGPVDLASGAREGTATSGALAGHGAEHLRPTPGIELRDSNEGPFDLTGFVRTPEGERIAGATVVGTPPGSNEGNTPWEKGRPRTTTDSRGQFRLTAARGIRHLVGWKEGYSAACGFFGPPGAPVEVVLWPERGRIHGLVRDLKGNPIAGARILASETWEGCSFGESGRDGGFSIDVPPSRDS